MNTDLLLERIALLCKEKGVNKTTAYIESAVGKNFGSNLKTAKPSKKNLSLLARYFDCSVEYLTGVTDERDPNDNVAESGTTLDEEEEFLLMTFRELSRAGKAKVYQSLLNIRDDERNTKGKTQYAG